MERKRLPADRFDLQGLGQKVQKGTKEDSNVRKKIPPRRRKEEMEQRRREALSLGIHHTGYFRGEGFYSWNCCDKRDENAIGCQKSPVRHHPVYFLT